MKIFFLFITTALSSIVALETYYIWKITINNQHILTVDYNSIGEQPFEVGMLSVITICGVLFIVYQLINILKEYKYKYEHKHEYEYYQK
jgi:hypothetical protein